MAKLFKILISKPFQSSPFSAILVPFCSTITPKLVLLFLSKQGFLGFATLSKLQFRPSKKWHKISWRSSFQTSLVAHLVGGYSSFCSMRQQGKFLLPPGQDASPLQGVPPELNSMWEKRGTICYKRVWPIVAVGNREIANRKSGVLLKNQRCLFAVNGLYSLYDSKCKRQIEANFRKKNCHETPTRAPITNNKIAKFCKNSF